MLISLNWTRVHRFALLPLTLVVSSLAEDNHVGDIKAGTLLFKETIRPLLTEHCLRCHGDEKIRSGLDLSRRETLLEGGDSGLVIDLDHPDKSWMLVLLRHQEKPFMPNKKPRLPETLVAEIERWISLGAPYDKPLLEKADGETSAMQVTETDKAFWSFRPLVPSSPPAVAKQWALTPIDQYLAVEHQKRGVTPNAAASKRTLVRRASLDLLGLPPSPEQIEAFEKDTRTDAWERLIDSLLSSPHYGERQARFWLDIARFAESTGFEHDYNRAHAWHYRDFLIEAFNNDLPWDTFVRWNLAGDELAPENPLAWKATGFLSAGVFPTQLTEAEFEQARYEELDDMVGTTSLAFLGLSVGCARCHDHKYDPIPASDYYEMAATFATAIRSEKKLQIPDPKERGKDALSKHQQERPTHTVQTVQICSENVPKVKNHADGRGYPHFYPQVHHLKRGDPKQKVSVAEAGSLQVLRRNKKPLTAWRPEISSPRTSLRRATLARWMTDPDEGAGDLVARVVVNRLWQQHFGTGLVATPNDFGFEGAEPTHPELIDWMANDLVTHGWKLKRLHRMIMTSAAYRQSSEVDSDNAARDLENQTLWHFPARRLEGEAIRDSLLVVSGQLDPTMYGAGTLNEAMKRRSIYFMIKRSQLPTVMLIFDWPEHLVSIGKRATTTVAPQSLYMMNSPHVRSYAEALGKRAEYSVDQVYPLALGRPASHAEQSTAERFLKQQSTRYQKPNAQELAFVDFCQAIMGSNEFLYLP